MAHLLRVGGSWARPLTPRLLDNDINILTMSPIHIMEVMTAHARRYYDRAMIDRVAVDYGWNREEVNMMYSKGVEWDIIRQLLREKDGALEPREKNALLITACGGFWPEARRWRHGSSRDRGPPHP